MTQKKKIKYIVSMTYNKVKNTKKIIIKKYKFIPAQQCTIEKINSAVKRLMLLFLLINTYK